MRDVEETITCQISFMPIANQSYKGDVTRVLAMIERSGLNFHRNYISATVKGNQGRLWAPAGEIFEKMDPVYSFTLDLKISNTCGCS